MAKPNKPNKPNKVYCKCTLSGKCHIKPNGCYHNGIHEYETTCNIECILVPKHKCVKAEKI